MGTVLIIFEKYGSHLSDMYGIMGPSLIRNSMSQFITRPIYPPLVVEVVTQIKAHIRVATTPGKSWNLVECNLPPGK